VLHVRRLKMFLRLLRIVSARAYCNFRIRLQHVSGWNESLSFIIELLIYESPIEMSQLSHF
jgi:hypothetical protein